MRYVFIISFYILFISDSIFAQLKENTSQLDGSIKTETTFSVELTFFSASLNWKSITLDWQTATEVNNYGFQIERSLVSSDPSLVKWENIGFVQGSGNSNSPKSYSFKDLNPPSGYLQYRLKQIDQDGSSKYFETVAKIHSTFTDVKDKKLPYEFALQQNYPNPFNPSTKIQYAVGSGSVGNMSQSSEQFVTLKVYDILGNEVATLVNEYKTPGYYAVEFSGSSGNGSNLAAGIYIYQLKTKNFVSTKKMVLLK